MKKLLILLFPLIALNCEAQTFTLVKDIFSSNLTLASSEPRDLTKFNGKLFFTAESGLEGRELWSTDGTAAGTLILKDIFQGRPSSNPENLFVYNGKLYFSADDGTNGIELWATDGTASGTQILKDINSYGDGTPGLFTISNGNLFFTANDSLHGVELWMTDGTTAGTNLVKDISSGVDDSYPRYLTDLNGKLVFNAHDGNQIEPWISDGTTAGTQILKDINPGNGNSLAEHFYEFQGRLYFQASDGTNGKELWTTDGTTAGTNFLKDLNPGVQSSYPLGFFEYNGKLYFRANDGTTGVELWVTDGTTVGTTLVKDIKTNGDSSPNRFTNYDGKMFFMASNITASNVYFEAELFYSDGTAAGTAKVPGIYDKWPLQIVAYHGKLYFTAIDGNSHRTMWEHSSNGTLFQTGKIEPLGTTYNQPFPFIHHDPFVEYKGALYFHAHFDNRGDELWRYQTAAPTAVNGVEKIALSIYPNPTNDFLQIETDHEIQKVTLTDISGKQLWVAKSNKKQVNISELSAGIYFIQIETNKGTITKKIQKL